MEFEICGHSRYRILFHSQVYDNAGWLAKYSVTLESPNMKGTVQVDNSPYGTSPTNLFEQIENEWQGWRGEKSWRSLVGELELVARSDSTGHITIRASLRSGHIPPHGLVTVEFDVEPGQAERNCKRVKAFFSEEAPNKNRGLDIES